VAFISDDDIKKKLADQLKVTPERLTAAEWTTIITDSNASAKNFILTKLYARGYSLTQINGWNSLEEYQTDIALFWCLVKGATAELHSVDPTFIKMLDRRNELETLDVLIGDGIVVPADELVGGEVSAGSLDTTEDRYSRDMEL
jgi:hypothetical protein